MNDEMLLRMAVDLVVAKLNNQGIPAAVNGQDDMIEASVEYLFQRLRYIWRENHREDNVHSLNPSPEE